MKLEAYWLLFIDTFYSSLAINPSSEIIINVIEKFPEYNNYTILIISFAAKLCACIANYFLGMVIKNILFAMKHKTQDETDKAQNNYEAFKNFINKYYFYALIPTISQSYAKVIMVSFGIVRAKPILAILIIPTLQVLWHIYYG